MTDRVIVVVRGGCVTDVCSSNSDIYVSVLDYDNQENYGEGTQEYNDFQELSDEADQLTPVY